MTATTQLCPCGASPPPGHTICPACHGHAVGILRAIPDLLHELDVTISGQASAREGLGGDHVGFDVDASRAHAEIVDTLAKHAHRAVTDRPPPPQGRRAVTLLLTTPRGQAAWLASLPWLPAAAWAREFAGNLTTAHHEATRAIDRAPERKFIGWCPPPCGAALYALTDRPIARCPRCRSTCDVEESRATLLACATDEIADAATLVRALGIPASTIRGWRHRGQLQQATRPDGEPCYDPHGRPQYAVADVQRLALGVTVSTPPRSELTP